jgi:hypothetical protein
MKHIILTRVLPLLLGVVVGMLLVMSMGCEAKPRVARERIPTTIDRITFYPPNSIPEVYLTDRVHDFSDHHISFTTTDGLGVEIHGVWKIEPER